MKAPSTLLAALFVASCADGGAAGAPEPSGSAPSTSACEAFCDPAQGLTCDRERGRCVGACATVGRSYVGCEYLATVSANSVATQFPFAITVSNAGDTPAEVLVEGGRATEPITFTVAPGDVHVEELPWVLDLKICSHPRGIHCSDRSQSAIAPKGAYRVRSTAPVVVYQFSPLGYALDTGRDYSYTNDASLLVPVTALGREYVVPGWPAAVFTAEQGEGATAAGVTITAARDDTDVTVHPTAAIVAGPGVPETPAGGTVTLHLDRGDVAQLLTTNGDLTGSRVAASQPVQVIAAHLCANVPLDVPYCDHLEEVVFPRETLSTEYVVVPPAIPGCASGDGACGARSAVRVIAMEDDVVVETDPSQAMPERLVHTGDVADLRDVIGPFVIRASGRILVTQLMHGQCSSVPGPTADCDALAPHGDPAMALVVPTDQFREDFLFHAPTSYESRFATVVAPLSSHPTLDGASLPALVRIGASEWGFARVELGSGTGNHRLSADARVGVSVYGYGRYTSFWYPGGLDLEPVLLH